MLTVEMKLHRGNPIDPESSPAFHASGKRSNQDFKETAICVVVSMGEKMQAQGLARSASQVAVAIENSTWHGGFAAIRAAAPPLALTEISPSFLALRRSSKLSRASLNTGGNEYSLHRDLIIALPAKCRLPSRPYNAAVYYGISLPLRRLHHPSEERQGPGAQRIAQYADCGR